MSEYLIGPCSFFGDRGCSGGHIYGQDDQDEHCQLCGQPKDEPAGEPIEKDYEPEQAHGTAEDFLKHKQYGGTLEDY